jgi:DNA repair exonuclease SbcCD ATPase subunit
MAKKNRAKNNVSTPVVASKPLKQSGMLKGLFSKAGIELDPELENKLNAEQTTQLERLIEKLYQSIADNEQSQTEINIKQQELASSITAFDARKQRLVQEDKELAQTRKDIAHNTASILQREGACAIIEAQLVEREANAQAGFVVERQASLATMKKTFTQLQQQLGELEQQMLM